MSTEKKVAQDKTFGLVDFAKLIPKWFVPIASVVYSSGYLCVYTFTERFGIQEVGGDFLKIKYIHVGILILLFPVSVLVPLGLSLSIRRGLDKFEESLKEKPKEKADGQAKEAKGKNISEILLALFNLPFASMLSLVNMCFVFYISALFTPPFYFQSRVAVVPTIILVSILSPFVIDWLASKCFSKTGKRGRIRIKLYGLLVRVLRLSQKAIPEKIRGGQTDREIFATNLRWAVLGLVITWLDYYAFRGYGGQLWLIFWGRGWLPQGAVFYFVFMLLISFVGWRTNKRIKDIPTHRARREMRLIATCVSLMLYFFGVLAFAWRVYPWIPVAKGGGSFAHNPPVTISLTDAAHPTTNISAVLGSGRLVILERGSSTLFLADTNDVGGPTAWQEMVDFPTIVEVRRELIDYMVYPTRNVAPKHIKLQPGSTIQPKKKGTP